MHCSHFGDGNFSIQSIEVKGNTTYTDGEIINAIKEQDYVGNTLVMIAQNQVFGQTYLPFIENISMGYDNSHVLKVKVKEKLRAGVFEYMNKNVYFNSEGIALESRNQLFEGVPVVTGVSFDKLVLGKQIPVKGDYFNTIMNITKKISTYGLEISEIHFENEDEALVFAYFYANKSFDSQREDELTWGGYELRVCREADGQWRMKTHKCFFTRQDGSRTGRFGEQKDRPWPPIPEFTL